MAYLGPRRLASDLVTKPKHSILVQSYSANERVQSIGLPGSLNADGFGIGWYKPSSDSTSGGSGDGTSQNNKDDISPCIFTSTAPAWNNCNLTKLCEKIESSLLFAHVRAAYPGIPVSETNCHPFGCGRYMWMHNGGVARFQRMRRKLLDTLSDGVYELVHSFHSDSAVCFALFLNQLYDGTHDWNTRARSPQELLSCVEKVIAIVTSMGREQEAADDAAGIPPGADGNVSLLNFCMSDGSCLIATRYASQDSAKCASLYYALGTSFGKQNESTKEHGFTRQDRRSKACIVASEPVTSHSSDWVAVAPQHALVVTRSKCGSVIDALLSPILGTSADSVASRTLVGRAMQSLRACEVPGKCVLMPSSCIGAGSNSAVGGMASAIGTDSTHILSKHDSGVTALSSRSGVLYSGASDASIRAWDIVKLECIAKLFGHRRAILGLAVTDDDGSLLSCAGRTIKQWDIKSGAANARCTCSVQLPKQTGDILSLAAHGNRVAIGLMDGSVHLYDMHDLFDHGNLDLERSMTSPAGIRCPLPGGPCTIPLLQVDEHVSVIAGRAVQTPISTHSTPARPGTPFVRAVPAATAGAHGDTGYYRHCAAVFATLFVNGSRMPMIVSGGGDGHVLVWEYEMEHGDARQQTLMRCASVLYGHRGAVLCLCSVPTRDENDVHVLSGSADSTIRVWDVNLRSCVSSLQAHCGHVLGLCALPGKGSSFASCGDDGCVLLWRNFKVVNRLDVWPLKSGFNPSTASSLATFPPERLGLLSLSVCSSSRGASFICCGTADGTIRCLSLHGGCMGVDDEGEEGEEGEGNIVTPMRAAKRHRAEIGGIARALSVPSASVKMGNGPEVRCYDAEMEAELRPFVAIRSVSVGGMRRSSCLAAASFLLELLERKLGAQVQLLNPPPNPLTGDERNPIVLGRVGCDPDLPTLCFYGHYDVQPALENDWRTPPWELSSINGYLYGRGATDNKGPILAMVFALREVLDECSSSGSRLPCNVTFVLEGEEENGSGGFDEAIKSPEARAILGTSTDVVLISNTLWLNDTQPCLTWGMRGMMTISVEVSGPEKDLHSGNDGGAFSEPMRDLVKVLSTLYSDDRGNDGPRLAVRGIYDGVSTSSASALHGCDAPGIFDTELYRQSIGVPALCACGAGEVLRARWCEPSMSIVDIELPQAEAETVQDRRDRDPSPAGDESVHGANSAWRKFGPTRFSVIPCKAVGKVSIRFVPDQTPESVSSSFEQHIRDAFARLGGDNRVSVTIHNTGMWWLGDPSNKFYQAAKGALEAEWGREVLFVREGGTMPVTYLLEKAMFCPALHFPLGQSTDSPHVANERIGRQNLFKGRSSLRRFLHSLAHACPPSA